MPLGRYIPVDGAYVIAILVRPYIVKLKAGTFEYRSEIALHLAVDGLANAYFVPAEFLKQRLHTGARKNIDLYVLCRMNWKSGAAGENIMGLLAGITLLVVQSCAPDRPPGVLSEQEMVNVLMEIYQSEEKISLANIPYDSITKISPVIRQRILKRVNITDSVFSISMDYYMKHPNDLDRIYGALIDSLSFREHRMPTPDALPR